MSMSRIKSRFIEMALVAGTLIAALAYAGIGTSSAETAQAIPPPAADVTTDATTATAVFAGGCFWGVQAVFQHVDGVTNAVSGYAGGDKANAEYERVSTGRTGHAESVRISYDPQKVTYGKLLQVYFSVAHDPTQLNRQGPDTGTQYRSTVFAQNADQAKVAAAYIAQLNQATVFRKPIATTIETGKVFYPAEAYHQDYLVQHPSQPYIVINDLPKVEDLRKIFPDLYRDKPVLVARAGLN
jgi:peptide-methionine (S)-S-oxide reductase